METRKNLCAMLPVALHTRVRQEQEKAGMTLGEYVEAMITEYYDWKDGKIMTGEMRTLAAQIPAELFDRLDRYLKERGIKKKDFLIDIITRALEEAEADRIGHRNAAWGSRRNIDPRYAGGTAGSRRNLNPNQAPAGQTCGGKPLLQAVSRHTPACRLFCVPVGTLHPKGIKTARWSACNGVQNQIHRRRENTNAI